MEVGRLNQALHLLKEEFEQQKIVPMLDRLLSVLEESLSNPDESTVDTYQEVYTTLVSNLEACESNFSSPSNRYVFSAIGADKCTGKQLLKRISEILNANGVIPAQALSQLNPLVQEVQVFYELLKRSLRDLKVLNTPPSLTESETSEIGIVLQETSLSTANSTNSTDPPSSETEAVPLDLLTPQNIEKAARQFKKVFGLFHQLFEEVSPIVLKSMTASNRLLFFECSRPVASVLVTFLEQWLASYQEVCEMHQARLDLADTPVPPEMLQQLEAHQYRYVRDELRRIGRMLIDTFAVGKAESDKMVIERPVRQAVRYLSHQLDSGAQIEINISLPNPVVPSKKGTPHSSSVPEIPDKQVQDYQEAQQLFDRILTLNRQLSQLRRAEGPVLGLGEKIESAS